MLVGQQFFGVKTHGIGAALGASAPRLPLTLQRSMTRVQKISARRNSEADLYDPRIGIETSSTTPYGIGDRIAELPLFVKIPGGFIAVLACSRLIGSMMRKKRRNVLEERGFKRDTAADEDHYNRMMRGMKTVKYDDLSQEQMAAARKRRQREVANDSIDIDTLELPANHPFAVHQEVTPEEEELQRQRLLARRGLSAQDLELLKKTQQMADEIDRA
jgi:hypothetical protein